jgi:hypothetical protein
MISSALASHDLELVVDRYTRNFDHRAVDGLADDSNALGGRVLVEVDSDEWHCALLSFLEHHTRPLRLHGAPTIGFSAEISLAVDVMNDMAGHRREANAYCSCFA